jgi:hypothetical protein
MTPQIHHILVVAALIALIAWRLYSRIRRNIGRQPLNVRRPWTTVSVFPLLLAFVAFTVRAQPATEAALLGGILAGVALGVLGLRLTRFEATAQGLFYTPSAHLGIALSTLLVCRIGYRFITTGFPGTSAAPGAPPAFTPLTLLLIGTLAGYYCTYAAGLLRFAARSRAAPAQPAGS